ncbi:MAG: hypothetical protein ABF436_12340, partial [Acetobacter okinawensis]|uniref:hypothetical protein n=1 Tax=Acetobacter okinawensis TaxID=1076594 RepID=UPI0039E79B27
FLMSFSQKLNISILIQQLKENFCFSFSLSSHPAQKGGDEERKQDHGKPISVCVSAGAVRTADGYP